jgi:hypothetical protein
VVGEDATRKLVAWLGDHLVRLPVPDDADDVGRQATTSATTAG